MKFKFFTSVLCYKSSGFDGFERIENKYLKIAVMKKKLKKRDLKCILSYRSICKYYILYKNHFRCITNVNMIVKEFLFLVILKIIF